METIRVILADDHPIVRKGLKKMVEEMPHITVVDEVGNGFELIEKVRNNKYDLVILDISMPGLNGLDTINKLQSFNNAIKILILSVYPEKSFGIRFLKAGASGYQNKDRNLTSIKSAITTIMNGGKYFSQEILEKFAQSKENNINKSPHEKLSNREFEIMLMLASGDKNLEIAKTLMISDKTVSTYKTRLLEKMKMKTNADLTKYAYEKNLL